MSAHAERSSCARIQVLLWPMLDGELGPVETAEVRDHLTTCSSCSARFASAQRLQQTVRARGQRWQASNDVQQRLRLSIKRERRRRWMPRLVPVFAVAAALIAFVYWPGAMVEPNTAAALADAHVHSLLANHLLDVVSTDQHTVRPWFEGKIDYTFEVKDLAADGFPLAGARLDYLGGKPVAALVYRAGNHPVNVFVWPQRGLDRRPLDGNVRGFNTVSWQHGGLVWVAISDASADRLRSIAEKLR